MGLNLSILRQGVERMLLREGSSMSSSSKSDLPEDLVIEILSLLPVKSLLRFRCVCKSWKSLIESPSFVSKHNKSKSTIDTSKIIVERLDRCKHEFLVLSNETLEASHDLDLRPLRGEEDDYTNGNRIMGSCYGIICFLDFLEEDNVILWNPSTRESKVLPESLIISSINRTELQFGFGYDVKTNDFKVVKFVTLSCASRNWHGAEHRTEVYSLSTNSWRMIDDAVELDFLYTYEPCWMSLNGVLSNFADAPLLELKFETKHEVVLISFDMRNEVFLLTPLPALCDGTRMYQNHFFAQITALNESVALVQVLSGVMENCFFQIWVLNEYGSKGSWTKYYTIGEPNSNLLTTAWGFWKNSVLFMETQEGELVLCDLITQEIKILQVEQRRVLDLISYKESLVSIKGGNHLL